MPSSPPSRPYPLSRYPPKPDAAPVELPGIAAEHARSYDKGAQVEIAAHVQALKEHKSRARQHSGVDRLSQAVPAMAQLLARAAAAGYHLASITRTLTEYLEHYGGAAMQEAVLEALRRDVPHPNAVRHALEHARELRQATPLVVLVFMSDHSCRCCQRCWCCQG